MSRYIAFLRAVNVGVHVVKMERLRKLLESAGLSEVETFIASGNAIFESPARNPGVLETKIETQLKKSLGYEVATFIRTPAELCSIASSQPFKPSDVARPGTRTYVGFLKGSLDPKARRAVMSFKTEFDDFQVLESEIHWLCRIPSSESEFSLAKLEKATGMQATFRNSTTIRKMADRYGQHDR